MFLIRASVNALCRDDAGQISRDPRKNSLKTRRERLTYPTKLTKSHSPASIQLSPCRKSSYAPPELRTRIRSHVISRNASSSLYFFFCSKPTISMLEQVDGLILSLNVSRVGGGVHGHKAIISFLFLVSTVDRGALRGKQRTKPFSANSTGAESVRTGGALRMQQCSRAAPAGRHSAGCCALTDQNVRTRGQCVRKHTRTLVAVRMASPSYPQRLNLRRAW